MYNNLCRHNRWRRLILRACGRTAGTLNSVWCLVTRDGCNASQSHMQPRQGLFWGIPILLEFGTKLYRLLVFQSFMEEFFYEAERIRIIIKTRSWPLFFWFIMSNELVFRLQMSLLLCNKDTSSAVFKIYNRKNKEKKMLVDRSYLTLNIELSAIWVSFGEKYTFLLNLK